MLRLDEAELFVRVLILVAEGDLGGVNGVRGLGLEALDAPVVLDGFEEDVREVRGEQSPGVVRLEGRRRRARVHEVDEGLGRERVVVRVVLGGCSGGAS